MMSFDTYHPLQHLWFYFLTIALLEGLAVYIWHYRKLPGATPLFLCQACKSLWLLGIAVSSISAALPQKLFWLNLEEIMAVLFPLLWLMLINELSRGDQKIPRMLHYIFGGIVALLCLAIVTNSWFGLYRAKEWLQGRDLMVVNGPISRVAFINSYLLNAINYVLTVTWFLKTRGLRRRQALLFMIMPLFSWAGHMVSLIPGAAVFEPQPAGFLVAGLYITWFFYRWRVIAVLPQARETVIRDMIDGLLIVDEEDYIVAVNPAAKTILSGIPTEVGGKFRELSAAWPALASLDTTPGLPLVEAGRDYPGGTRHYAISMTPLSSNGNHLIGKVIILKDITRQKQDQALLLEQQKTLAILTERDRLGREIHDGQGQIWSYLQLQLQLQTIRTMLDNAQIETAGQQVNRLMEITKNLNGDVRETITWLKNSAAGQDITVTLQGYLNWYEKNYGIATRLTLPEEPVAELFNGTREVQLLRIIQEALTNIRKHAKSRQVEVSIQKLDGKAVVRVADDGRGFDPGTAGDGGKHYGLQIMKERAEEVGGRFLIESKPGAGTTVIVEFDLGKARQ